EKREARSEKREARSEKREARSEKILKGCRTVPTLFLNSDNEIQIRNQCCLQLLAISPRSLLEERSSLAIL
ncbi:hypothetical protein OA16_20555, partial [Vibrio vulnificus]